jgi:thioredoxin 1
MRSSRHNQIAVLKRFFAAIFLLFTLLDARVAAAQDNNTAQGEEISGLTVNDFNKIVQKEERLVLVNFSADWCLMCMKQKPALDEVAAVKKGKLLLMEIDMEKNPEIAAHFNVDGLPVNIIYHKGIMVWIKMGFRDKNQLLDVIALYE